MFNRGRQDGLSDQGVRVMKSLLSAAATGVLGLAAFLAAGAASAADLPLAANGRSIAVHYDDAELGSEAGARAVLKRIDRASRMVCRVQARGAASAQEHGLCRSASMREEIGRVDATLLSAAYQGADANVAVAARDSSLPEA